MLNAIKKLFGIKPSDASVPVESAPYKVEASLVQSGTEPTMIPAGTEASIIAPALVIEATPTEAIAPVIEAKPARAKRGPAVKNAPVVKKATAAPKKPRATKAV